VNVLCTADRHRPYLMTRVHGTNDYINAVFVDVRIIFSYLIVCVLCMLMMSISKCLNSLKFCIILLQFCQNELKPPAPPPRPNLQWSLPESNQFLLVTHLTILKDLSKFVSNCLSDLADRQTDKRLVKHILLGREGSKAFN